MSETMVENKTCLSCGIESRSGALFCYNCGNSVTQEVDAKNEELIGDDRFRVEKFEDETQTDNIEIPENVEKNELDKEKSEEEIISEEEADTENIEQIEEIKAEESEKPEEITENKENLKTEEPKQKVRKKTKLRSASALRRKGKFFSTRKTEIIWEERENAPNVLFLVVALFLILFALVLFFLAMYLK